MAQTYRCRRCGRTVTVGVPTFLLTQEVSAALSREFERPIRYHDWSPTAADQGLRERGEKLWEEKCDAYYQRVGNLRALPQTCPACDAASSWDIVISASGAEEHPLT